jgi:bifunctional UDP-N-acetylglucosamine pyrophosphorylase/glucosamine-1-phosphate N-acetyltransferase
MQALLLIAGQSKRFWPLTEKSLFPVAGKPLLQHQIERLQKAGIKNITLVGGKHNLETAKKLFPKLPHIEQKDLALGMRGALLDALPKIKNEPVMIVSGNDVIDPIGYKNLLKEAAKKGIDGALLASHVKTYFPGGYLSVKGDRITGIIEKPGAGKEPSDLVNIVAHIHNDPAALLKLLKTATSTLDDGYEVALDKLLQEKTYNAVRYSGLWQAVKFPWHLLTLNELLLQEVKAFKHKTAKVHKSASIDGNVVLEANVKVLPHATIVGPCVIGEGSVVGTGALVRGSSIGKRCVVGFNTEIKSSVLADDVWTHMTYLGDSVIGNNVSFGGGCITGNYRLDENEVTSMINGTALPTGRAKVGAIIGDNCRLGIHVGINPGVKIGKGSFVAGGTFVSEDLPMGSFARMKEGKLTVGENREKAPGSAEREKYRP